MEVKLTELMAEDFDLGSHPRLMELAQLLTREAEMDETTQVDGDIHVEKVESSVFLSIGLVCVCVFRSKCLSNALSLGAIWKSL